MIRIRSNDGVPVALHDLGGTGPELLISHATGFHAHCHVEMAAALADRFHSFALDHRGHGESVVGPIVPGDAVDWQAFGDDCLAVAQHLAPSGGLVGFGHSMGAAALILAAQLDPRAFRALVLFEPIAFPPTTEASDHGEQNQMVVAAQRRTRQFASYDAAYQNYALKLPMSAMSPATLRQYVDHGFRPVDAVLDGADAADRGGVVLRCSPDFEAGVFMKGRDNGVWNLLADVEIPVVVISGRVEPMQPSMIAESIARSLPHGTYVGLDDVDHFGPFTHPARLAEIVATELLGAATEPTW